MFPWQSLLLFVLVGPIIGAIGTGETIKGMTLLPIYLFGGLFAAITWLGYSVFFAILDSLSVKYSFIDFVFFKSFVFLWGAVFASISGFALFSLIACGSSSWLYGGNINCIIHIFNNQWGMVIVPAAICGSFGTIFLDSDALIRR